MIRKAAAGNKYVVKTAEGEEARTEPVHFAQGAMDALGEAQADKAAEAILKFIEGY